jgi:hypothetical protein
MESKFVSYLTKIIESSNPHEVNKAWSNLKEMQRFQSMHYNCNYNFQYEKLLNFLLTKKRITNIDQVATLLKWFSKFIHSNASKNTIPDDIANFLCSSAESFKVSLYE